MPNCIRLQIFSSLRNTYIRYFLITDVHTYVPLRILASVYILAAAEAAAKKYIDHFQWTTPKDRTANCAIIRDCSWPSKGRYCPKRALYSAIMENAPKFKVTKTYWISSDEVKTTNKQCDRILQDLDIILLVKTMALNKVTRQNEFLGTTVARQWNTLTAKYF